MPTVLSREEPRFVTANGVRFAYLESGAGPLVLLVHGFPDTAHTWDHVRPALAGAGFRAVAIFTRGYAPSSVPADGRYDSETLGRDLLELVPALGEKGAIVVGHDWGASAAYAAAALGPSLVRKLVTVAIPHPASMVPSPRLLWSVRHFFRFQLPDAAAMVRRNDFAHVDELVRRWSPAWNVPPGETDPVKAAFREPGSLDAALGYYRALRPTLPAAHRKKIEVDSVCFAGEHDIVDVSAYDRARSRFKAGYEVVRMPGGHFMHREHPERFTTELLRVLGPAAGART
jgi:pimeloyl-ACP methyl ester carboxylesterase